MKSVIWFIPNKKKAIMTGGAIYNEMFYNSLIKCNGLSFVLGGKRNRLNPLSEFVFFVGALKLFFKAKKETPKSGELWLYIDSSVAVMSCLLIFIAKFFFKVKIVVTCHHLMKFDYFGKHSIVKEIKSSYEFLLFQLANVIVTNSQGSKNNINKRFHSKIELISPPVKYKGMSHTPSSLHSKKLIMLGSVMNPRKLHRICIEALPQLISSDITLQIIGDVDFESDYYKSLLNVISSLSLDKRVSFAGRLDEDDLIDAIKTSYLMLMPGVEGYGMAAAEVICFGKPVIGNAIGGIGDVITNHHNGILLHDVTSKGISDAINSILEDPVFYDKLQNGCYQSVHMYSSPEEFVSYCQGVLT